MPGSANAADFTAANGTATIPAGATETTISVAVIDDARTAGKKQIRFGKRHFACRGGDNGRALRRGDIDPEMGPPRFAVQDALRAVYARQAPL